MIAALKRIFRSQFRFSLGTQYLRRVALTVAPSSLSSVSFILSSTYKRYGHGT